MHINFILLDVRRRSLSLGLATVLFCAGTIVAQQSATAGQDFFLPSPKKQIAVHDFGEEHAHLADSVYDTINPLVLAALPRGKAYIEYHAPANCVPGSLKSVLARVAKKFGPITVNSTYRSPGKNRKAGGKEKSMHLACRAVDFRVHGSTAGLTNYLLSQREVGGYNRYPAGFYHIDNGPRRTW